MRTALTVIYVETPIFDSRVMHSQKFTFKNQVKNQITSGCVFIMQTITRVDTGTPYKAGTYIHHTKRYYYSYN